MRRVVFYSWQSDLPNRTNRSFIQRALENVTKGIRADSSVDVEPVVDRDTQGIAGSPDISKTIFQKIANADMVVADVSHINPEQQGRPTPNPNVLLELGYALHALGEERVVLVFNTAYGRLEDLPFDLRMRRAVSYSMPDSLQNHSVERKLLESKLGAAVRDALGSIKPAPVMSRVAAPIDAVEKVLPNRTIIVGRYLSELYSEVDGKRPKSIKDGATTQDFLDAIDSTVGLTVDFTRLAATVAAMGDEEVAVLLYRGFGPLLDRYDTPIGYSAPIYPADFDFMKFVGHELFTTFFACFLRERKWALISTLLSQVIPVKSSLGHHAPSNATFNAVSEHLEVLGTLNQERGRLSVHADVLKARHEKEPLGPLMPVDEFVAADYFLFLRGELTSDEIQTVFAWRPWSSVFLSQTPRFLVDARQRTMASEIARAVGVPDVETFKARLRERVCRLSQLWQKGAWNQPIRRTDIDSIASA